VQCITLQIGSNFGQTGFITNKGTSESITATAVDVQGCIVPKPALTWTSSAPAALTAGSATTGCTGSTTCTVSTPQPGAAAITASCTPPACNVGFPLVPAGVPRSMSRNRFTSHSHLRISHRSHLSHRCARHQSGLLQQFLLHRCPLHIATSKNIAASPSSMPTPPNSLMFDPAGDKIYAGSQYGALLVTTANLDLPPPTRSQLCRPPAPLWAW